MSGTVGLILAAGPGSRYGGEQPKQFEILAGRPVLVHSVRTLAASPSIQGWGLLVPPGERDRVRRILSEHVAGKPLFVETGGATRRESVHRGLERLREVSPAAVAVHDAARPAVTVELVERVVKARSKTGAAGVVPVLPVTDTVKVVDPGEGGVVRRTPPRKTLRRAQTPQVFAFRALREAHEKWDPERRATDDAMMLEAAGRRVVTVEGSRQNLKLTRPRDRQRLERYLEDAR